MDGGATYELLRLADILQFNNNYARARVSFKVLR